MRTPNQSCLRLFAVACTLVSLFSLTPIRAQEGLPPPAPATPPPVSTTAPAPMIEEEGFTTSPTGLKYKDIVVGDGAQPQKGDKLKVHYTGTLEDGFVFDSSVEKQTPLEFRIGLQPPKVIPGWEEGMLSMKVGGKRKLIVPSQLAYGLRGRQPKIPPNATLRFEIELLGVEPGPRLTETRTEGEVAMPSGLRYVEIKPGEGEAVTEASSMKLRAARWNSAGVFIDTTADQADPMTVEVSRPNMAAMREGFLGMKAGGKRKLFVPSRRPAATQPASQPATDFTIVEVELVEVFTPPPPPAPTPVKDEEYTATPSGLKYYDITVGQGESPNQTSRIKVHYTGWLTDGKVFYSSVTRGQPEKFALNDMVKGWIEGVGGMKVGGKRKLVIPPEMAYGAQGRPSIPPNSTLIFEVELLEITQP